MDYGKIPENPLLSLDKSAQGSDQSYWRDPKKRIEAQENASGVCFSCRQVPPGRDSRGHRHPAQIRFTLGVLRQEVIAIAKQTRGRRKVRFATAAKAVVDKHRNGVVDQPEKESSRKFLRGMDLSTRAKIITAHLTQAQFEDPDFAAQLYVELGERLGIQPPLPKTANEEPPCNPPSVLLRRYVGRYVAG